MERMESMRRHQTIPRNGGNALVGKHGVSTVQPDPESGHLATCIAHKFEQFKKVHDEKMEECIHTAWSILDNNRVRAESSNWKMHARPPRASK